MQDQKEKESKKMYEILVDLTYDGSMNQFEEFYRDSVTYQEIEQESYIELKSMLELQIGKVKVKKARDISNENSLTCKITFNEEKYKKFRSIYRRKNSFKFLHNFIIKNLRLSKD